MSVKAVCVALVLCCLLNQSVRGDWPRFRGPNGMGSAVDSEECPTVWSPEKNLAWKVRLPGPGGSLAVDVGGLGDVTETHTIWQGRETARFATPVRQGDKIFVIANGILKVIDAKTGRRTEQLRLRGEIKTGGRFGPLNYASPVIVGNRLYYLNGKGQVFVFSLDEGKPQQIAVNQVTKDNETFWGSPAVSDGHLLLRSSHHLYCIAEGKDAATSIVKTQKEKFEESVASSDQTSRTPTETNGEQPQIDSPRRRYKTQPEDTRPNRPLRPELVKP